MILLFVALAFVIGCKGRPPAPPPEPPPPPPAIDTTSQIPPPPPPPEVAPLQLTTIYFDYDKSDIRADARTIMGDNARSLSEHPTAVIMIEGHCDERGTDEYNMALGERRANSAKNYLTNYGIEATRVNTISYGESRPAAPGQGEDVWQQNRRAEFKVMSE
jgi:peptidoglycan-associated lipoprotein